MKDKILRSLHILIGAGLIAYVYYLFSNQAIIVKEAIQSNNLYTLIWIWAFGLINLYMWIRPICFKKPKTTIFLTWIVVILFSKYSLMDNPWEMIYMADILNILWVLLIIGWISWAWVLDLCKKKLQDEKTEIIEV